MEKPNRRCTSNTNSQDDERRIRAYQSVWVLMLTLPISIEWMYL